MERIQDTQEIYLDNSATTQPCPEAVAAANEMMVRFWGNPSSTMPSEKTNSSKTGSLTSMPSFGKTQKG